MADEQALLIARLRRGDSETYSWLFRTYYPRLKRYAGKFITDDWVAEDVVQDSFVRLFERREELSGEAVSALLYTMVRNRCLNYLKHQVLVRCYQHDVQQRQADSERLYALDMKGCADEPLIMEELERQLTHVMEQLPQRSQEIFYLSRQKNMKNKEIAECLGISVKVVEKHISKVLAALRNNIRHNADFEGTLALLLYYMLAG